MRTAAGTVAIVLLAAIPLGAQGRGRYGERSQGIPPGHLPPPGSCRVWYDDRPPGHQPPPTSCREAERIAARDRYARVIYGSGSSGRDDGWWGRDDRDDRDGRPRVAVPRNPNGYPYPDRYPYPDDRRYPGTRGGDGYGTVPFETGYRDGFDKGREDARDRDAYDPRRHGRYRSADRGYDRRYGSREEYRDIYREGFRAGYDEGYRERDGYGRDGRRGGFRLPWPF